VEVRLFGELEAADGGVALAVRGVKQQAPLALLALSRGEPVSADRLIDALRGDGAASPANALRAQIGRLRRTLGAAAIVTSEAGYALEPLAEVASAGFADIERAHLDELTVVAIEARSGRPWRRPRPVTSGSG
jgi:DNA-binding SARP family transcriptional activator